MNVCSTDWGTRAVAVVRFRSERTTPETVVSSFASPSPRTSSIPIKLVSPKLGLIRPAVVLLLEPVRDCGGMRVGLAVAKHDVVPGFFSRRHRGFQGEVDRLMENFAPILKPCVRRRSEGLG